MANRKVVARAVSVIEAQAIQSILKGAEIDCFIDNANISSIFPHETQAFGGVMVSVWEHDEERAKNLLDSELETILPSADEDAPEFDDDTPALKHDGQFRKHIKLALASAVIGSLLLPVVSNIYSIHHLQQAYQIDRDQFWSHKGAVAIASLFNLATLVLILVMLKNFALD